jgi:hypothetical protein
MDQMTSVGFGTSIANTFLFGEEEGDSHDPPTIIVEKETKDIDIVISATNQNEQRGRVVSEIITHSPNFSQRSDPPKKSFHSAAPDQKKYSTNNSKIGGDQNPLKRNLERSCKLQVKIKIQSTQQEVEKLIPKDEVFLEDMDLDVDIENIDFPDNEKRLQDRREVASEIETQEQSSSEDESLH